MLFAIVAAATLATASVAQQDATADRERVAGEMEAMAESVLQMLMEADVEGASRDEDT
ncbi:MAG: hypothetical protein WCF79_13550 [Rhodomicrobium sp.]